MEQDEPDVQPLAGPDARRCAECKRVLVGRRADATWCSARCRMRWKRKQKNLQQARESYSAVHPDVDLTDLYDHARDDERLDDEHPAARRPRAWDEADERFHALIGDNDEPDISGQHAPRSAPLGVWRRWRAESKRNPGVEPREQQQDRIGRQKAARDASMARLDAMWPGRAQDRHDPRTASNPGRNGAASRKLNQRYVETPPAWTSDDSFDFQAGESWTGGPYRAGRSESGQRSRSADYAWNMRDGW